MKRWQVVLTIGMVFTTPCLAQDVYAARFQDPATQRYYEQNRQLYEQQQYRTQQMPVQRVWRRYENRYDNQNAWEERNARPERRMARVPSESSQNRYQPHLMPDQMDTDGEKVFIFSPKLLTWAAYDSSGQLVRKGHGSAGRNYCPDIGRRCHTPTGSFRVQSKRGAECKSSIYPKPRGGAKMPYCMFFHKHYAVHGSYDVPDYNASHGCVRVYPQDAQWLNSSFMSIGTKVIVKPY